MSWKRGLRHSNAHVSMCKQKINAEQTPQKSFVSAAWKKKKKKREKIGCHLQPFLAIVNSTTSAATLRQVLRNYVKRQIICANTFNDAHEAVLTPLVVTGQAIKHFYHNNVIDMQTALCCTLFSYLVWLFELLLPQVTKSKSEYKMKSWN